MGDGTLAAQMSMARYAPWTTAPSGSFHPPVKYGDHPATQFVTVSGAGTTAMHGGVSKRQTAITTNGTSRPS